MKLKIVAAAFHRAERYGVDHQPRLPARLDREQAGKPLAHRHWLIKRRANGAVPPFGD
jgi:hypothetical protein